MALYKDFNISFEPDPLTGDILTVEDEAAVIQSVKNLVLTSLYERPFQPSLGSNIYETLFEPLDQITQTVLAQRIKTVIDQFEPRATVKFIDLYIDRGPQGQKLDDNELLIEVGFLVYNLPTLVTTEVILRRLR